MKDFTRNCVEGEPPNICDYSLNVYEADFRTLVTSCNLHIEYEAGQSALDFGKANCTPGYWANGGYNKPGPENPDFQVISIVKENEPKNLVAYFGVDDNKINSGHGVDPVISDVGYVPGEFAGEAKEEKRNTIDVEKATSWKVLNMNRGKTSYKVINCSYKTLFD
jgi:hypothetical protein